MQEKEELFFIGLKDPVELRRTLLESAKDVIEGLQRYEKFKSIRKEKIKQVENLRSNIREINKFVAKLKSELPQTSLKPEELKEKPKEEKKANKAKKEAKEAPKKEPKKEPRKELTELEKLESELDIIESRLGAIK